MRDEFREAEQRWRRRRLFGQRRSAPRRLLTALAVIGALAVTAWMLYASGLLTPFLGGGG